MKAKGIVDVTKNQNDVRTALNNVTLVRLVICRSIYMYPWTLPLGVYRQGVLECYISKQLLTIEAVVMM